MATTRPVLDTTQYVQVNQSQRAILIQNKRDTVRVTLSDVKPARANTVFHVLSKSDPMMKFRDLDTNVWVLSMTDTSSISVTENPGV